MGLRLHILLNKVYYEPGEAVICTAQIYNDADTPDAVPANVRELVFSSSGLERTDPSWIQKLFRPEAKVESYEARRGIRTLFKTEPVVLQRDVVIAPSGAHQFMIKFKLPHALPPSFKGSSTRFHYTLDIKALYELKRANTPSMYETTATTSLLIWPSAPAWSLGTMQSIEKSLDKSLSGIPTQPSAALPAVDAAAAEPGSSGSQGGAADPAAAGKAAAVSQDTDFVALVDYKLQQSVKIKVKEVAVDEVLLKGGPAAVVMGPNSPGALTSMAGTSAPPTPSASGLGLADRSSSGAHAGALKQVVSHHPFAVRHRPVQEESDLDSDTSEDDTLPSAVRRTLSTASYTSSKVQGMASARTGVALPRPGMFGRAFILNAGEHPVLKLTLQAPLDGSLQPGCTFTGLLDLRPLGPRTVSPVRCHQLVIMLETEEVISAEYRPRSSNASATAGVIRKLHGEHQEMTSDLVMSHFMFSIPTSVTPSFNTPMVSLRWVLRFDLTVGAPLNMATTSAGQRAGPQPQMQQLSWALPLLVQAPAK